MKSININNYEFNEITTNKLHTLMYVKYIIIVLKIPIYYPRSFSLEL